MTEKDILNMRDLAEAGKVQFKERITSSYEIGCEMVAFSNSHGGRIIIGIHDKTGKVNGLSYSELQETTNLLSNIASENVLPNILIDIENVPVEDGAIVVANIHEGKNKPYHDNKGIIWMKNGSDKRRVFDNAELAEIHSPGTLPDSLTVADIEAGTSMPRNSFLFNNAIYLLPYTGAGSGIRRALETGLTVKMENNLDKREFLITIPRRTHQEAPSEHQVNEETHQVEHQEAPSKHQFEHQEAPSEHQVEVKAHQVKLTKQQIDILNFCSIPRTAQEILNRVGVVNQSRARKRYIQPLIDMGVLEMTNPENPSAWNQKYRKTNRK